MKTTALFITLQLLMFAGFTQSVVSSAGLVSQTNDFSLSWTIGETVTGTGISSSTILTQGFQQPWITITSVRESETNEFLVYPNPVDRFLTLEGELEGSSIQLFNAEGKLIDYQRPSGSMYSMNFNTMSTGVYLLIINTKEGQRQQFNIVKN